MIGKIFAVVFAIITSSGWQWTNLFEKRGFITAEIQTISAIALTILFILQQIYLVLPKPVSNAAALARSTVTENFLSLLLADYYKFVQGGDPNKEVPFVRVNIMLPTLRAKGLLGRYLKIYYAHCPSGTSYNLTELSTQWRKGEGLCGSVWKHKHTSYYDEATKNDIAVAPMSKKQTAATKGLKSVLCVPIWCRLTCIGVLNIDSEEPVTKTKFDDQALQNKVKTYVDQLGEQCFMEGVAA